jgi:hypothetical protein
VRVRLAFRPMILVDLYTYITNTDAHSLAGVLEIRYEHHATKKNGCVECTDVYLHALFTSLWDGVCAQVEVIDHFCVCNC